MTFPLKNYKSREGQWVAAVNWWKANKEGKSAS